MGWERLDDSWWPSIAAALEKPWPLEAVYQDLRWWGGQERQKKARRPGRPALGRRWGWTDWKVKQTLRSGAWEERYFHPAAEDPPADRQPAASPPPARRQESRPKPAESHTPPPARRQPAASDPPADRPPRVLHDPRTTTHVPSEEQLSLSGSTPEKPDPVQVLYEVWRGFHPRARDKARAADASKLRARLREDSPEDCALVCRWIHDAPDAQFWRDGGHTGLTPVFKADKWSDRLSRARKWRDAGYTDKPMSAMPPRHNAPKRSFRDALQDVDRPNLVVLEGHAEEVG